MTIDGRIGGRPLRERGRAGAATGLAFPGLRRGCLARRRRRRRGRRSQRRREGAARRGCPRTWRRGRSLPPSPAQDHCVRPDREASEAAGAPASGWGSTGCSTAASPWRILAQQRDARTYESADVHQYTPCDPVCARTCWQSSLVGTSTSALGEPWAGPAESSTCSSGKRYAAVLPLPVLACAITSCWAIQSVGRKSEKLTLLVHKTRVVAIQAPYSTAISLRARLALKRERDSLGLHRRRRNEAPLRGRPHHARVEPQGVHERALGRSDAACEAESREGNEVSGN